MVVSLMKKVLHQAYYVLNFSVAWRIPRTTLLALNSVLFCEVCKVLGEDLGNVVSPYNVRVPITREAGCNCRRYNGRGRRSQWQDFRKPGVVIENCDVVAPFLVKQN